MVTPLTEIARFPRAGDNAAIALMDLSRGSCIQYGDTVLELRHDVLTGHRFATQKISKGCFITSWNYPFGKAVRDIEPGEYLCNKNVLFRLSLQENPRFASLELPDEANFTDDIEEYHFDPAAWQAPCDVAKYLEHDTFYGFRRGGRGTGTRNHLVILGTSSTTASLVKKLEKQFKDAADAYENVDAVVGLRHTEGDEMDPEERDRTLRTLSGLISNPNVGAVLSIEGGLPGEITNEELEKWMRAHGVQVDEMDIVRMRSRDSFSHDLDAASKCVRELLEKVNAHERSEQPVSELKVGLQCGASDAFSGICGNVLAAAIAREIIRFGGSANLTETPELSGAEDYTLSSIRSPEIATRFLSMMSRFKDQLGWHGGKVDKNPSEGNLLGGLYNITLKSLGAAVKRDPSIPIQHVIEYAEPMTEPGFYFMDGMGGDIASYTGQAAAGCNLILFVTGRGTPTNSSIVPTVKIVNTSERYQLMADDIDINAGQYLDGQSMEDLTSESLQQVVSIASGEQTLGEQHHQNIDLLWRRKFFQSKPNKNAEAYPSRLDGMPVGGNTGAYVPVDLPFEGRQRGGKIVPKEWVGLILPTVGCSVATAEQAAADLNKWVSEGINGIDRFVALANTEGCGTTTGAEILNFILSYANHHMVKACAFVSLGCEMVSPGFIKSAMRGGDVNFPEISSYAKSIGYEPDEYGWFTIQECGGTSKTMDSVKQWFAEKLSVADDSAIVSGGVSDFRLGLAATGDLTNAAVEKLTGLVGGMIAAGGTVVVPSYCPLLQHPLFLHGSISPQSKASLVFAQNPKHKGLHIMQMISENQLEQVTGLGAATDVILHYSESVISPAHSLVPTLNIGGGLGSDDYDADISHDLPALIGDVLSNRYRPRQNELLNEGNQIPRGPRAHAI